MFYDKAYVGAPKNFFTLLTFTEIFAPLNKSVMLKNEKIRQKYPFLGKGEIFLKLSELRVVAFAQFAKKSEKIIATLWICVQKKLLSHSATRWLSLFRSFPRMLQLYPASNSYFMSIDKSAVVLKRFFGNSLSEFCLTH